MATGVAVSLFAGSDRGLGLACRTGKLHKSGHFWQKLLAVCPCTLDPFRDTKAIRPVSPGTLNLIKDGILNSPHGCHVCGGKRLNEYEGHFRRVPLSGSSGHYHHSSHKLVTLEFDSRR